MYCLYEGCKERQRELRIHNSKIYYRRIEILGNCLFLQSVLATLHICQYIKVHKTTVALTTSILTIIIRRTTMTIKKLKKNIKNRCVMHDEKTETETEKRETQRKRISLFVDTLSPVNYKGLHQDYQHISAGLLVILYTSQ